MHLVCLHGPASLRRDGCRQRLPLLDNVGREDASLRRTGIDRIMNGAHRNHERLSDAERHRRLALELERDLAFQDVADFFSWVSVSTNGRARLKLGDRRDDLATAY